MLEDHAMEQNTGGGAKNQHTQVGVTKTQKEEGTNNRSDKQQVKSNWLLIGQGLNTEGNSIVKKSYINKVEHLERLQSSESNSSNYKLCEMDRKVNVIKWRQGRVNTAWLGLAQNKSSRSETHASTKKITGFPHLKCDQLHSMDQI